MLGALEWLIKTIAATVAVLIALGAAITLGIVGALQLADLAH